jgi:hypothetical protein
MKATMKPTLQASIQRYEEISQVAYVARTAYLNDGIHNEPTDELVNEAILLSQILEGNDLIFELDKFSTLLIARSAKTVSNYVSLFKIAQPLIEYPEFVTVSALVLTNQISPAVLAVRNVSLKLTDQRKMQIKDLAIYTAVIKDMLSARQDLVSAYNKLEGELINATRSDTGLIATQIIMRIAMS